MGLGWGIPLIDLNRFAVGQRLQAGGCLLPAASAYFTPSSSAVIIAATTPPHAPDPAAASLPHHEGGGPTSLPVPPLNSELIIDVDPQTIMELRQKPLEGCVCLQNHGGNIEFRELRAREIRSTRIEARKDPSHSSRQNGRSYPSTD